MRSLGVNKRVLCRAALLAAACSSLAGSPAAGQLVGGPSTVVTPYEIVSGLSSFGGNGLFGEGVYRFDGGFEFEEDLFISDGFRAARFAEAATSETLLSGGVAFGEGGVAGFLGLEDLSGNFVANPFAPWASFVFSGVTPDDVTIDLGVAVLGRWLYAWGDARPDGDNDAAPDYRFSLVAAQAPVADANRDLLVNAADYTALRDAGSGLDDWRGLFGSPGPDPNLLAITLDGGPAGDPAAATARTTAVPEPGTAAGALCLSAALVLRLRAGRRR